MELQVEGGDAAADGVASSPLKLMISTTAGERLEEAEEIVADEPQRGGAGAGDGGGGGRAAPVGLASSSGDPKP